MKTDIHKMDHHFDQTFSNVPTHPNGLQLAPQNKRLIRDILPFEVKHYQRQDELNIFLNTAKQLKYHYFAVEQQRLLFLSEKASQVSRTAFLSFQLKFMEFSSQSAQLFSFMIL